MNQQALEAADKAAWEESWPEIPWDTVDESIKEDVRASTIAALTAYAEACGETVIHRTAEQLNVNIVRGGEIVVMCSLRPGEELVVRKAGT